MAVSAGMSVLLVLGLMIGTTTRDALPVFQYQGVWSFFTSDEWRAGFSRSEFTGEYGAFSFIYGTVVSSAIAVALALPLALAVSLYINRIAPKRLKVSLSYTVELLAAIPSVVYGLWGLLWFLPTVIRPTMDVINLVMEPVPVIGRLFVGPIYSLSYFTAGVVLAIMILPIITAITREVMAQVPRDQVDAAYGMGATDFEVMTKVIMKSSFPGIVGGTMLGLGRALGETIAVAMLIGGSQRWGLSLFFAGDSLAGHIANTFQDAAPETVNALIAIGVSLFVVTVIVNVAARLLVWRIGRVAGDAAL
ncbi:MAG: phosphate ABC transporter permease subunit PstC [Nitriliruptor sp.]|nr:MAG: phosphate ABC transporter permease subunit PstC [Nitriliruptor sp.]